MNNLANILIIIHATFGGIALISGTGAIVSKKGSKLHRKTGKIFYYTMLISAIIALVIALLPTNWNPFLFSIGIFSTYLIVSGKRALKLKLKHPNIVLDKLLALIMLLTGLGMICIPLLVFGKINIVLTVFGSLGMLLSAGELRMYYKKEYRKKWLVKHIGNMTGGYLAACTAFVVVNQILPGVYGWLVPTAIGSLYIIYWSNKIKTT